MAIRQKTWVHAFAAGTLVAMTAGCGVTVSDRAVAPSPSKPSSKVVSTAVSDPVHPGVKGRIKIGLVTNANGSSGDTENRLAVEGLRYAERTLHVEGSYTESTSSVDYATNLRNYASLGYNVVIAVGYLMDGAVRQVASQFPHTSFVILDDPLSSRPNVTGVTFRTAESAYLAGAIAGLMQHETTRKGINKANVIGVVAGMSIPPVNSYIAGFKQGAMKTDPTVHIVVRYANGFLNPAQGEALANEEIAQGADIIMQVAANTGVGVFRACRSHGVYAIGVGSNQTQISPQNVLTSAVKNWNSAVFAVIKDALSNQLKPGVLSLGVADGAVGITPPAKVVPKLFVQDVEALRSQIASGKIQVNSSLAASPPKATQR